MLMMLEEGATHVGIATDHIIPSFRNELYDGYKDGFNEGLGLILNRLEHAYIDDPGRPDRGSPKGEAILELARGVLEDALPAFDGAFHLEAFLTLEGPVFSELGSRIGGGCSLMIFVIRLA